MKKQIVCICLLLLVFGCKKDAVKIPPRVDPPVVAVVPDAEFRIEVRLNKDKLTTDVECTLKDDEVMASLPITTQDRTLIVSFKTKDAAAVVKVDGVVQTSGVTANDFIKPVTYTVTDTKGAVKTYKFSAVVFTGLPIFNITSAGPVTSKEVYVTGSLSINPNGQYVQDSKPMDLQIKGRGNSTWTLFDKKPYRLKLNTKASILGLTAAKNWVLLANYSDKTLMRNYLAFNLAQQIKSDYAPHGIFVEVFLNGEYRGNYMLCEQVEVNPGRVNITELKAKDTNITGGYLIEMENRIGEVTNFMNTSNLFFNVKAPEDFTPEQLAYICTYMQDTENAIYAANFTDPVNGYAKYINPESFIKWFLVNELFKNQDAQKFSSIFYFKDRDGKMGMGPVWDFDLAAGNLNYSDAQYPEGWWVRDGSWMRQLYKDPAFAAKVKLQWDEMKAAAIPAMFASIAQTEKQLTLSAQQNFTKWNILNVAVWPNPAVYGTYPKEVEQLKSWLTKRVAWLDANIK